MIPGQAYEGAKARCVQTAFIVLLLVALLITVFHSGAEAPHLRRTWCPACRPGTDIITGVPVPTNYTGRYAFIDLGANRADTLWVFLGRPGSKFTFNFSTPNDGRSHEDAEIFLFEANVGRLHRAHTTVLMSLSAHTDPRCLSDLEFLIICTANVSLLRVQPLFNMDLVRARQWGLRRGMDIQIFPSHIVHTADTVRPFSDSIAASLLLFMRKYRLAWLSTYVAPRRQALMGHVSSCRPWIFTWTTSPLCMISGDHQCSPPTRPGIGIPKYC